MDGGFGSTIADPPVQQLMSSYCMALNWFSRVGTHVWALAAEVIPGGTERSPLVAYVYQVIRLVKATSLFVALITSPLQFFTCNRDHIRTSLNDLGWWLVLCVACGLGGRWLRAVLTHRPSTLSRLLGMLRASCSIAACAA